MERGAGPQVLLVAAWDRPHCPWKELGEVWKSEMIMEHVSPIKVLTYKQHSCESNPTTNLLQNILLSHEFLSFSAGFVNHDLQNILPTVGNVHHKEN